MNIIRFNLFLKKKKFLNFHILDRKNIKIALKYPIRKFILNTLNYQIKINHN